MVKTKKKGKKYAVETRAQANKEHRKLGKKLPKGKGKMVRESAKEARAEHRALGLKPPHVRVMK